MPSIIDSQCVLVIGATSGIGRALALAIHALSSSPTVIVSGRRQDRLDELLQIGKEKGGRLDAIQLDVTADAKELKKFVDNVVQKHPKLDTIIFSSGIQHIIDFTGSPDDNLTLMFKEFNTNYTSLVTLVTYFLPHLLNISSQNKPTFLIPITSGLGILPLPNFPNYCATKAAVHSLAITLRLQLEGKGVNVIEIIPPLVESELHDHQGNVPQLSKIWVSLDDFTKETMEGLIRGDREIYPRHEELYNRFEKGKIEEIERRLAMLRKL